MILNQNMVLFFQSSQLLILIRKRYSKIAIAWPIKTCINVSNTHLRSTSSTAEARLFPALFSYMINHIVWSVGMEGFYILSKLELKKKYNLCLRFWWYWDQYWIWSQSGLCFRKKAVFLWIVQSLFRRTIVSSRSWLFCQSFCSIFNSKVIY